MHVKKAEISVDQARSGLAKIVRLVAGKAVQVTAPKVYFACPDPDDNKFDCVMAGNANCVVSIDPHLIGVENAPVPVLSPWQFLRVKNSLR